MPTKELMQKYRASNTRKAIARAIRAEFPDGSEIFDRCAKLQRQAQAAGSKGPAQQAYHEALDKRDEYEDEIRSRYGMPPMSPRQAERSAQFPVGPE